MPVTVHELIAAHDAACRAFDRGDYTDHKTAERKYLRAFRAALRARPETIAECAAWLRWALKERAIQENATGMPETIAHIARRLEALAGWQRME